MHLKEMSHNLTENAFMNGDVGVSEKIDGAESDAEAAEERGDAGCDPGGNR